jgi:Zn-finger protein
MLARIFAVAPTDPSIAHDVERSMQTYTIDSHCVLTDCRDCLTSFADNMSTVRRLMHGCLLTRLIPCHNRQPNCSLSYFPMFIDLRISLGRLFIRRRLV